ncbi:MAG: NAD(P)H-hydrate dehydratase [Gammaproteobacteria bacterium]|nr:NAD(P)H-hydrate dehydratase [Pseudomonadales bacterium]
MSSQLDRLPRALYQAAQVRELDRIAIEDCRIEGFALMRRAAALAFAALLEKWPQTRHLLIFVGTGNNGGDGYLLAGLAKEQGLNPELIQVGDHRRLRGDALRASEFAARKKVHATPFQRELLLGTGRYPAGHTVVVDALLGTGLDRSVSGDFEAAINIINDLPFPVLAIDIPSGLSSDTGNILGVAVQAALTTTFIGLKQGLLTAAGVNVSGAIVYGDLDVPERVFSGSNSPSPAAQRIDMQQMSRLLAPRLRSANKGHFGHTVILGGDYGFGGAALMAAAAALRAGSGLVSVITRSVNRSGFLASQPELMVVGTEDPEDSQGLAGALLEKASVIVVGPGLGRTEWSRELLNMALKVQEAREVPLVVDADGLNLLALRRGSPEEPVTARENWILTPHPGEAARLLDCATEEINADRFAAVRQLKERWGGVVLLKGAGSLICYGPADRRQIDLCSEGNPGMASGGMGDILSGLAGGLVAQHYGLENSLRIAVCVHGEAADLAVQQAGQRGLAATDLLPFIQKLVNPAR